MDIRSRKGFALAMIIILTVILLATHIALYAAIRYFTEKETGIHNVRSYYAAISGMRYASILLRNPDALTFDGGDDGHSYVFGGVAGDDGHGAFFADIDIPSSYLSIVITEWYDDPACDWPEGAYKVTGTYSSEQFF